jgi:hypothetical protein
MSSTRQDLQAEIFKAARKGQTFVIGAIKTSAGAVRSATPHVHATSQRLADRLPRPEKLAGNARHLADRMPKPHDVAGSARHLAGRMPKPHDVAGSARHLAGRLPKPDKLTGDARHLSENLPKAGDVAANARHFGEKLLASQQKLAADARRASAVLFPARRSKNSPRDGDAAKGEAGTTDTGTTQPGPEGTSNGGGAA